MAESGKNKILIFVTDKCQIHLAQKLGIRFSGGDTDVLILVDHNIALPDKEGIKSLLSYRMSANIKFLDIWQEINILVSNLTKTYTNNISIFKELTNYRRVCLWEISFSEILFSLVPVIEKIKIIDSVLQRELPKEVIIFDSSGQLGNIISLWCQIKQIHYRIYKMNSLKVFLFNSFSFAGIILDSGRKIKRFCVSLYCRISNFLKSLRYRIKPGIMFFTSEERSLETLLPVIKLYSPISRLVINTIMPGSSQRLGKENILYHEIGGYILNWPFDRKTDDYLKKIWDFIKNDKYFQEGFIYNGVNIYVLLDKIFYFLIFTVFKQKIRILDLNTKIMNSFRPKFIVVANNMQETICVAKNMDIPVMAMQCASPEEFFCYGPLYADMVTSDGKYWKELMINNGIPESKIVVTGPAKFDIVFKRKNEYTDKDRKYFFSEMSLDRKKKLIVWAGTHTGSAYGLSKWQYQDMVFSLFDVVKSINGVQLLVKLHPYEFDFKLYKEIAKKAGLNNLVVVKYIDKWELLFACDLLLTFISMLSYDAVIVDKPVINLQDFDRYLPGIIIDDVWNLKNSGAVVCLSDFSNLKNNIEEILFNTLFSEELKTNRRRYIENHLSFLGEASWCVKKIINRRIYS